MIGVTTGYLVFTYFEKDKNDFGHKRFIMSLTEYVIDLETGNQDKVTAACNEIFKLASDKYARKGMLKCVNLLESLVSTLKKTTVKNRTNICGIFLHLSIPAEHRKPMADTPDLILELSNIMKNEKGNARVNACGALLNLSSLNENRVIFIDPSNDILNSLNIVLSDDQGKARKNGLTILSNLMKSVDMARMITETYPNLIKTLSFLILADDADVKTASLDIVLKLSSISTEMCQTLGQNQLNLISSLSNLFATGKPDEQSTILKILENLLLIEDSRIQLTSSELSFLPSSISLLKASNIDNDLKLRILSCFILLSQNLFGAISILGSGYGLIPAIASILDQDISNQDIDLVILLKLKICFLLSNLFSQISPENFPLVKALSAPELGLFNTWHKLLRDAPENLKTEVCKILCCIAHVSTIEEASSIISYGLHNSLISLITVTPSVSLSMCSNYALTALAKFGRYYSINQPLKTVNTVAILQPIIDMRTSDEPVLRSCGLKSLLLTCCLIGRDEPSDINHPPISSDMVSDIIHLFQDIMKNENNNLQNFFMVEIDLDMIMSAVLSIAVCDVYKPFLNSPVVGELLISVTKKYLENSTVSMQALSSSLDTFLHLTFQKPLQFFSNEKTQIELQSIFSQLLNHSTQNIPLTRDIRFFILRIQTILSLSLNSSVKENNKEELYENNVTLDTQQIIEEIPVNSATAITNESNHVAHISESTSLSNLSEVSGIESQTEKKENNRSHVMISYCNDASSKVNTDTIKLLVSSLKDAGYDVWRDEDGSKLVEPMLITSSNDKMVEAVNKSHTVIICVSLSYKHSSICRSEANYINERKSAGLIHVIYVMMDSGYHTASAPLQCDGWIGDMMKSSTTAWLPLWDNGQVSSTTIAIANMLGNNAKIPTKPTIVRNPFLKSKAKSPRTPR
jgi:hypothetical protein